MALSKRIVIEASSKFRKSVTPNLTRQTKNTTAVKYTNNADTIATTTTDTRASIVVIAAKTVTVAAVPRLEPLFI
jgi:uncharacterized membrane protein